jgi:hypothetical protein
MFRCLKSLSEPRKTRYTTVKGALHDRQVFIKAQAKTKNNIHLGRDYCLVPNGGILFGPYRSSSHMRLYRAPHLDMGFSLLVRRVFIR